MSKFNNASKTRTGVKSPITSTELRTLTGNGAVAYKREEKSELFLLAVANMVGKDTFYESAKARDDRYVELVRKVAPLDAAWFRSFVAWLRNDAFMRSAAVVAAVEGGKVLQETGKYPGYARAFVAASMGRADEPGEALAYYESKYGKNFPAFLKKGVADGARALYNEYSLLKYDTESKGYRFADVIQLSHAKARDEKQNALFSHALDRRYNNANGIPDELDMLRSRSLLMTETELSERRAILQREDSAEIFKRAGMTWEALSGWLQGPMDKQAWEAVIPSMGYMALLRNLRNFLQAGVSAKVLKDVLNKLSDPEQVAKSKQFPFRFLSAYQANKGNLKVSAALEEALEASLSNVPELSGKTLILVDRSGSMFGYHRSDTELTMADKAAIFGSALALRAENATLVQFGSSAHEIQFKKTDSVLPMLNKYRSLGGTATAASIKQFFKGHDRVVVITDEQYSGYGYYGSGGDPSDAVPANVPLYTWNLEGYSAGGKSGSQKRHTFGGLTDKAFTQIPLIEAGQNAAWPWDAK
jgi:hypothetical protein